MRSGSFARPTGHSNAHQCVPSSTRPPPPVVAVFPNNNPRTSETGMRPMSKSPVLQLRSYRLSLKMATTPSCASRGHLRRTPEIRLKARQKRRLKSWPHNNTDSHTTVAG